MTNKELTIRLIGCDKCGNWEELPIDQARDQVHSFHHLDETEDDYKCGECGDIVTSTFE